MVRRSGVLTGIGNPDPELMDGQSSGKKALDKLINQCAKDCYNTFFKDTKMDYDGVDAGAQVDAVRLGIEPAYFGDNLKMIEIREKKELSTYQTGHAFGYYGSGIRSRIRSYRQYKRRSKFVRFIDKWHPLLFKEASSGRP